MDLHLYSCPRGTWLLVPACMAASHEATATYGPVTFRAAVDSDALAQDEWNRTQAEFDARSFAEVAEFTALRLLGVSAPGPDWPQPQLAG